MLLLSHPRLGHHSLSPVLPRCVTQQWLPGRQSSLSVRQRWTGASLPGFYCSRDCFEWKWKPCIWFLEQVASAWVVLACANSSWPSIVWMEIQHLVYSSAGGHLSLLWIRLLGTFMCKFLCGHVFSSLSSRHLGVELLCHVGTQRLTLEELARCFPKWLHHFVSPPATYGSSNFSASSPTLVIVCLLFITAILVCSFGTKTSLL